MIRLVYLASILWRLPRAATNASPNPPVHSSWIPFLGHIFGIATKGSNLYLSSLCAIQRSPIATLKLPGQDIHLIHPRDVASVKQFTGMRHLSLMAVFHVAVGPAMGLGPASEKFLTDPDTGGFKRGLSKLFNGELRSLRNLQKYASQLEQKVDEYWGETFTGQDPVLRTGLGAWLFDLLSRSMGAVFWGQEGPFEDELFRQHLRLFIQNLETLRNPITPLIPSQLFSAREYVRNKITQSAHGKAYGHQGATLFERLALLYESLEIPQEGFSDCHLVAIVGLMSNVINIVSWAFCHIVADAELMACLLAELEKVAGEPSSPNLVLDADQIRTCCPLLVATWYELLRVYGDSPVARGVNEDCLFDNKYQLSKGSMIMTPIHLLNFDMDVWGGDAAAFRPRRFLQDGGQVNAELVKHLNVFGLPGMHQCPGRYLGLTLTLAVLAKTLLSFDITPIPGDALAQGTVPKRKETMLGLPAMSRDPDVIVRRRGKTQTVHIVFDNVRPGW
ncbi:cytochrome p450 [Hirsutella rhossiliensis]|uniref:Cytochrome p450 domain-containing protein n=1 Tax=Hirsutella rhossiliensis TaxID=111463 RepID=A0A9P8MWI9_9HYPO|nr:cytochrome p450 domain-containing protein [Hirsutella rhossiliensis]KAH0962332.1 cytochrome p450 domain-containing protein [Hirsutella rhossiliensis]